MVISDRFVDVSCNAPAADSCSTASVEHVVELMMVTLARARMQFRHRLLRQTYFLSVWILLLVYHSPGVPYFHVCLFVSDISRSVPLRGSVISSLDISNFVTVSAGIFRSAQKLLLPPVQTG